MSVFSRRSLLASVVLAGGIVGFVVLALFQPLLDMIDRLS